MSVVANVITPQGLEPFQIPTKIRSPSLVSLAEQWRYRQIVAPAQLTLGLG